MMIDSDEIVLSSKWFAVDIGNWFQWEESPFLIYWFKIGVWKMKELSMIVLKPFYDKRKLSHSIFLHNPF